MSELKKFQRVIALDQKFKAIEQRLGLPKIQYYDANFSSLVLIILEQQVSISAARSVFEKLKRRLKTVTAENFLLLSETEKRDIGFSKQKQHYVTLLAENISAGFKLDELSTLSDQQAKEQLMQHKGIGAWTATIYLMFCLRRENSWPTNDLALKIALQHIDQLDDKPDEVYMHERAKVWEPYRSYAAHLLWHYYRHLKTVATKK